MDFDFSSISPAAHTIAISAYIDFLPSLQYSKPLGTSRFLKTIECLSPNGYVVVKLLVKPMEMEIDMTEYLDQLNDINRKLENIPNTVPFNTLIDSERATYMIRPYIRYNLYDRLSVRPFFESIEKKWIVYQLLVTLAKMHEVGVYHGDLKTENVLLTSWNWALLSDIGLFKPVILPDHNQTQFSFYFDTSQRHSCCIAPERFKTQEEINTAHNDDKHLRAEFDIFSLGCVIAELYTDGIPLFSLPQMFQYRNGLYKPNLDAIDDISMRKLIQSMISLDPSLRLTAKEYLQQFRKIIFPDYFYTFLYSYMRALAKPPKTFISTSPFQSCDYIIDRIYKDFDKVSLYLGFKANIMETDEHNMELNRGNTNKSLIPVELNLPGMNRHIPQRTSEILNAAQINDAGCLILLSIIFHNTRNTTHSFYRVKACDLILALSEQLHDEAKLDRCLPYLINMLDDPSENVQVAALCSITQLLMIVDTITPINVHIFAEYIIPKLQLFLKRSYFNITKDTISTSGNLSSAQPKEDDLHANIPGSYVRVVFASCLPQIAMCAKKFAELSSLLKDKDRIYHDPDTDSIVLNNDEGKESEFDEIFERFEHLTIQILTDGDVHVRIALLRNIQPLCSFFGKDKTNDVILSHVITYLNDKDTHLKLNFISSIVPLSIFVGITSLEQYILPLLMQALYGPEDIIVVSLLKVLAELISLGLIKNQCFVDLVSSSIVLLLHPNGLIRQCVISLILTIAKQLHIADFYCTLYPLIRPFLQHEVTDFTWANIFLACHEPVPMSVYNALKLWSLSNEESLFWQRIPAAGTSHIDSFGNTKLTFSKRSDASNASNAFNSSQGLRSDIVSDYVSNNEVPLSNTDKKYIYKLTQLGFEEGDLWKVATLRYYIFKVARLDDLSSKNRTEPSKASVIPRSVFVEVKHKQVPKQDRGNALVIKSEMQDTNDTPIEERSKVSPLILKTLQPVRPIVSTSDSSVVSTPLPSQNNEQVSHDVLGDFGEANVFDERMKMKEIKTIAEFSYLGKNSSILQFLKNLKFEPELDDYPEFGDLIKRNCTETASDLPSKTQGNTLVARLVEHKASILDILLSPDHRFFISADTSGVMKIWDTKRLEIDVTGDSCLSVNLGVSIKSITMMKDRNCFAVSKSNGTIDIYRVDFISTLAVGRTHGRRTSITLLRRVHLESDEYAVNLKFCIKSNGPFLFAVTSGYKLIAFDLRGMNTVYEIKLNALHGFCTSFVVSEDQKWAAVGTSNGIIDLLDLDAQLCVKSTKFKHGTTSITQLQQLHDTDIESNGNEPLLCFIGGTEHSAVIIWSVSGAQPRTILCSNTGQSQIDAHLFTVEDSDVYVGKAACNSDAERLQDNRYTALLFVTGKEFDAPRILSARKDKKITDWNLRDFGASNLVIGDLSNNGKNSDDAPKVVETKINSHLSVVHEKYVQSPKTSIEDLDTDNFSATLPADIVTSLQCIDVPSPLMICGDRKGYIYVYK